MNHLRKIIMMVVFQGLLMGVLSQPNENCRKEESQYFDIYDTLVNTKAYYCVPHQVQCNGPNLEKIYKHYFRKGEINLTCSCQSNIEVNLLANTVKIDSINSSAIYSDGHDQNFYWLNDMCKLRRHIYGGIFDVWSRHQTRYINNTDFDLQLTSNLSWCGTSYKTNLNGIIVSAGDSTHSMTQKKSHEQYNFRSTFKDYCITLEREQNSSPINTRRLLTQRTRTLPPEKLKTYYVYQYPTERTYTMYYCISNISDCDNLKLGRTMLRNESAKLPLYHCRKDCTSTCNIQEDILCVNTVTRTQQIDNCNNIKAIWTCNNRCLETQEQNYTIECNNVTCQNGMVLNNVKHAFCGDHVWNTNVSGVLVSENKLKLVMEPQSPAHEMNSNTILLIQNEKIDTLQKYIYYLALVIMLCVLWCIFNAMIDLSSLWTLRKRRRNPKNKCYLLNFISYSLTNRYLHFSDECIENKELDKVELPQQVYESIVNEIYNK